MLHTYAATIFPATATQRNFTLCGPVQSYCPLLLCCGEEEKEEGGGGGGGG